VAEVTDDKSLPKQVRKDEQVKTRIVEGDSNDLVKTYEVIGRGAARESVIDRRTGRLLKSIHGCT